MVERITKVVGLLVVVGGIGSSAVLAYSQISTNQEDNAKQDARIGTVEASLGTRISAVNTAISDQLVSSANALNNRITTVEERLEVRIAENKGSINRIDLKLSDRRGETAVEIERLRLQLEQALKTGEENKQTLGDIEDLLQQLYRLQNTQSRN